MLYLPLGQQIKEIAAEAEMSAFALSNIPGFPQEEFLSRRVLYHNLEAWYSGEKLKETQTQGGRVVEKYPIKLNPIRGAVYKHAYALFGEIPNDSRPLAPPSLHPDDMSKKDQAQRGQNFLNSVWADSSGRSVMIRNSLHSQLLGGCIFKASYVPKATYRTYPFKIESVHPANFVGVPISGDEFRLSEAWIVKAISPKEALRRYGLKFANDEPVYYVEYWNPDEFSVTINGYQITTGIKDELGNEILYGGRNPWGFVPIEYFPRLRTSDFYGESLISENVQGIVEEYNRRMADFGDAISDDAHSYYKLLGTSQRPEIYEIAPGIRVIQVKAEPSITGKEQQPELDKLGDSKASESMKALLEQLYLEFRREAFVPAVSDGEDEGSQRSAMTLAMRMWPLLSITSLQRVTWGDGLAIFDNMILRMAQIKGIGDITQAMTKMRIERKWAPFLPKDREAFINELVNRASGNLGSLEHLLSLLDDIEDPEGEYKAIIKQIAEMAQIEADATAEAQAAAYEARASAMGNTSNSTQSDKKSTSSNSSTQRSK